MKKTYYLFNPGRMSRKDNTLVFVPVNDEGQETRPKYLPVEGIEHLYIFGSVDANSALYNFLGKQQISVHFFDYYEHYTGSFQPKDQLLAGKMQVEQTKAYLSARRRLHIAQGLIEGASFNMLKNLRYYQNRDRDVGAQIAAIEGYRTAIAQTGSVPELMGIEGNCRQTYYQAFEQIIQDFPMNGRSKQPPSNEVNALISFGNMMCYTLALDTIYHTQLNPTISFLHEPGARRYSLALDLAEVFKPILVDRTIFKVFNQKVLKTSDFEQKLNGCFLKNPGKQTFIRFFEERLSETIQHRTLNKKVSYKHLVRLECYKLAKYILNMESAYKPFKIWW
ncbi:MAG TPA: type I-B CRISPR-associated endonuclease Cas1b [Saprospiraceae bacterium]|nr:type I-B CRISPR-associated endonuclease Cas1b [Saprospiraceae bacterium]